ncbi:hypothetical protein DFR72_1011107 [Lentzea flaviverrucosa]|uniref:Uncharacterized protein n=2 Tax=Lentzea flaviverrucosa TaxID=200379 RepID=A0A1H9EYS3_9PSEU|nr:hypothetical protein DFR72_1011107 [Lentzea flaviverrucosa]SEQ30874.1 hypothetical protein SAMN05216195_102110 [Lentzea flaviverrucosa]
MGVVLPTPDVLFALFQAQAGTVGGAREAFQMLVTDLVSVRHPAANEVAGPGGGDWGIDTYVGRLDDSVVVWQSKFFPTWGGKDQQQQVRDSFKQLLGKAKSEGFRVDAWTLCVPCILPPGEQRWFDGWKVREGRRHNVKIGMWNGIELRRQLMQPDAEQVYRTHFAGSHSRSAEPVRTLADVGCLGDALFVRQLEAAGNVETDAARGLFFAAEALARDLAAAGNKAGVSALNELHLDVQSLWEQHFNARVAGADDAGKMQGLIDQVLLEAGQCCDPEGLKLRPAHRKGVVHRLVEDARAGWVRHWRHIAASHQGPAASETVATQLEVDQPGAVS